MSRSFRSVTQLILQLSDFENVLVTISFLLRKNPYQVLLCLSGPVHDCQPWSSEHYSFSLSSFQCLLVHRGIAAQMELEVSQHSTGEIPCQQRSTCWVNTSWKPYCTNDYNRGQGKLNERQLSTYPSVTASKAHSKSPNSHDPIQDQWFKTV